MLKYTHACCVITATVCLFLVGCGGHSIAPVTGKLTLNGEPLSGIKLVFYPKGADDNPNPGPFSSATTGQDGTFTLKTRDGQSGAVIGDHRVCIEMNDGGEAVTEEDLGEAQSALDEAVADGDKAGAAAAKKQVDRIKKKLAKLGNIPSKYLDGGVVKVVNVPGSGLDNLELELAE